MEGFFEKNAQGFIENSMPVRPGECLLWSRPVQRNGFGAVKRQLSTIRQMEVFHRPPSQLHGITEVSECW